MPTRRTFLQTLTAAGLASALGGCEQASESLANLIDPEALDDFRPPVSGEIDLVTHALNRLTYGAQPGEYRRVAAMGVDKFIDEQLDARHIGDRRCDIIAAQVESVSQAAPELYDIPAQQLLLDMTRHRLLRAIHSRRQLFEVMVEFWTDHFNIVSSKGDCKWLKLADDREVIRPHALGNFRDMLKASALSPAMLVYLDGHDNKVEHADDRPNENYARELLELHTLGVHGGYTQRDVMEVARCLSGWTVDRRLIVPGDARPLRFDRVAARFHAARHDQGEKVVLGQRIPAGGGAGDLDRVLEIVCAHESTAGFIATKLCRRFIADAPPDDAVKAATQAFGQSGGDIPATLRAIFDSAAFRDAERACRGNLLKRPMHLVVSALRATQARTDAGMPVIEALERMGHAPFQYPTPDGYPLEEQPWLGGLLWRWNFALALQHGAIKGTRIDAAALRQRLGGDDALAAHLLGRAPSDAERGILEQSGNALALLLCSPAFQRS